MSVRERKDQAFILKVLETLVRNGLNFNQTAKETKIPRSTIRVWAKKEGIASGSSIPREMKEAISDKKKVSEEVNTALKVRRDMPFNERERQFELDVFEAKELMIQQIKACIPRTWDVERIARSMKLLDEIIKCPPPGEDGDNKTNNLNQLIFNFTNVINEQLKYMDYEPTDG